MIYVMRVTTGQERIVGEMLARKAKAEKLPVYSIVSVDNVRGYLFVEAKDEGTMVKLSQKMRNVKGFLRQPISVEEIEKMVKVSSEKSAMIKAGDIVELIAGPFKGEKARVRKTDEAKDELTVELIEVAVPIPVTIKVKMARLAEKAEEN